MKTSPDARSTFTKMANYPENQIGRNGVKLKRKSKNSASCVHFLHKTLNKVISRCYFAEDGKEMDQNAERLFLLIEVLRRCLRRRRCLSSLLLITLK